MRYAPIILLLLSTPVFGQGMTSAQQKALNSYVEYANQSADEVSAVVAKYYCVLSDHSSKKIVGCTPVSLARSNWKIIISTMPGS